MASTNTGKNHHRDYNFGGAETYTIKFKDIKKPANLSPNHEIEIVNDHHRHTIEFKIVKKYDMNSKAVSEGLNVEGKKRSGKAKRAEIKQDMSNKEKINKYSKKTKHRKTVSKSKIQKLGKKTVNETDKKVVKVNKETKEGETKNIKRKEKGKKKGKKTKIKHQLKKCVSKLFEETKQIYNQTIREKN